MNDTSTNPRPAHLLALNGALMILAGLLIGAVVPAAPYPRLMLAAHIGFTGGGVLSIVAGVMLKLAFSVPGPRGAALILWAHVSTWAVSLSEVAGAFWGTTKTLPLAGALANAPGGAPWQETIVLICHVVPSVALIAAWGLLAWGALPMSTNPN